MILSVCPPHAARDVARSVAGLHRDLRRRQRRLPRDAPRGPRAASPTPTSSTAASSGRRPRRGDDPAVPERRSRAGDVAALFDGHDRRRAHRRATRRALKMAYAAWTKGSAALLLAAHERRRGLRRRATRSTPSGPTWPARAARRRASARRSQGLALGRRDGGDRRHVRRRQAYPTASTAPRPRCTGAASNTLRPMSAAGSPNASCTACSSCSGEVHHAEDLAGFRTALLDVLPRVIPAAYTSYNEVSADGDAAGGDGHARAARSGCSRMGPLRPPEPARAAPPRDRDPRAYRLSDVIDDGRLPRARALPRGVRAARRRAPARGHAAGAADGC